MRPERELDAIVAAAIRLAAHAGAGAQPFAPTGIEIVVNARDEAEQFYLSARLAFAVAAFPFLRIRLEADHERVMRHARTT